MLLLYHGATVHVLQFVCKLLSKVKRDKKSRVFPKNICARCGCDLQEHDMQSAERSARLLFLLLRTEFHLDWNRFHKFYRRNLWEMISRHEEVQTGATALRGWRMYGVGILNLFHGRHLTAFLIPLTIKNNANSAPPQRYNHFLIRASFAPSPTAPPSWSQSPRVDFKSTNCLHQNIVWFNSESFRASKLAN